MPTKSEGGLRNHRIEFIRESTTGTVPTDPAWNLYSDTVRSVEWGPDTQIETVRGIGDAAPSQFFKGPETHELTVTYDLQQKSGTGDTLYDGTSSNDAAYDGMVRDSDQLLNETHSFVDREDKTSISAEETINGSTSLDTRVYTVGKGGYISEVTLTGDPGSDQPIQVELTYQFEKIRSYQIDQPSSGTTLDVSSSDSNDTSQTLTIEDEGAGTTEDVSLSGTSTVSTSSSFSDIDALELDSETAGTVTVNDGTNDLAKIDGSSSYSGIEGDLGVPALGSSGSHASAIGESFEVILGDSIEQPSGTDLAYDVNSVEFTVSNNIEQMNRTDSLKQRLFPGGQDIEVTATILGETESHNQILDHLQVSTNNVRWTISGGYVEATSASLTDPGSRTVESGQAAMTLDNTFTGQGVTISN